VDFAIRNAMAAAAVKNIYMHPFLFYCSQSIPQKEQGSPETNGISHTIQVSLLSYLLPKYCLTNINSFIEVADNIKLLYVDATNWAV
jgi:hypothetical protein